MKRTLLVFLPLLLILSCKSTHKLAQDNGQPKPPVPSLKKENIHTLVSKLKANRFDFKWISAKASVDLASDSGSISFTCNMRMRRDSLIWMSISKFGLKELQVLLTQDSVMGIDYHHNSYFTGDYGYINTKLDNDVDFDMLQSLMIGSNMEFYSDTSKMNSYFDGKQYIISTIRKRRLKRIVYQNKPFHSKNDGQFIFLDPTDFHIAHIQVKDFVNNRTFDAYYSDYQKVDSVMFPFHIQYVITAAKTIKVDIQYKKVSFSQHEDTPYIIPKKYARVQY